MRLNVHDLAKLLTRSSCAWNSLVVCYLVFSINLLRQPQLMRWFIFVLTLFLTLVDTNNSFMTCSLLRYCLFCLYIGDAGPVADQSSRKRRDAYQWQFGIWPQNVGCIRFDESKFGFRIRFLGFSESFHSARESESRFSNLANPVLMWIC